MKNLSNSDYKLFEQIVKVKQYSLLKTMSSYLNHYYDKVYTTRSYVYTVGDIPIALVAHLDTVFKNPPNEIYYDRQKNVIWSPEGLGADDRAGVFAIIKIIKAGYRPHIIFTTDEELGAIGASSLTKDIPDPFADMKYIIQLDRKGVDDCVFYDCINEDFIKYVESFGFVKQNGSFSDICEICPMWEVAGVNLSIGYQREHSISETFHITPFFETVDKVIEMLKDHENISNFKYISRPYVYNSSLLNHFSTDYYTCSICNQIHLEYELFPVKCLDNKIRFYCPDCMVNHVKWCNVCGEAFEPKNKNQHLCANCHGENQNAT